MENATKALLIAAAVLVVILLIAFGMKIMNSTGSATSAATSTGSQLSNQAEQAGGIANTTLTNLTTDFLN